MLTRGAAGTAVGLAVLVLSLPAQAAMADAPHGDAHRCAGLDICTEVDAPGSSAKRSAEPHAAEKKHPKKPKCTSWGGEKMPCSDPEFGTYYNHCYVKPLEKQPPKSDAAWEGHKNGAIYTSICPDSVGGSGTGTGLQWLAKPPGGAAVDPAQLAQQALDKMTLNPPEIHIRPKPSGEGLVGMPVWMWVGKSTTTWGPNSASASAGGITVTAKAKVERVTWDMGDGHTVVCDDAGTPYKPSYGKRKSPDCGHIYDTTSKGEPGEKFQVEATSTWAVDWEGGGQSGQMTETRTGDVEISVGEAQVLN